MDKTFPPQKGFSPNETLFSKALKAGRRVYYIDVKQDKREEFYLTLTESKRGKDSIDGAAPHYEKHKIFLYREDLLSFLQALKEAADFVDERHSLSDIPVRLRDADRADAPHAEGRPDGFTPSVVAAPHAATATTAAAEDSSASPSIDSQQLLTDFDIEF